MRHFILELTSYEGDDTACYLLGAEPMWVVASVHPKRGAAIIDWGYRSLDEVKSAWPEAVVPELVGEPRDRGRPDGWNGVPPILSEPWFQAIWRKEKQTRARPPPAPLRRDGSATPKSAGPALRAAG